MSIASHNESVSPIGVGDYAAGPAEYFALLKPRVMSLVIWTALAGLLVAPTHVHPVIAVASILAIAVGAGAAGALNMWWDADIDALMARTRLRPIPAGLIDPREALFFGLTLSFLAVLTLAAAANLLAAALLAFTIFFYVAIYTMWLKRSTPQNIVIGGAAGALPPVVGYAVATGSVTLDSLILFAIIFVWTPPHFWALALVKSGDYARAGIPMMPNVKGADRTRLEILIYTLVLVPLGILPWRMGIGGDLYAAVAIAAGAGMAFMAMRVFRIREGSRASKAAMQLFAFSILYLFLLFSALVVEHGFGLIERFGL
ncbi:heme o synthase [Methylocapsa sp. S129]|uniref:heme o synthase n=1 Tax=Methylocapsa sp. S129 TaxID=1641869 RepID=UPI00131B684C|nr:heme o synthase [Methylocapsa sp. S129]